MDKTKNLSTFPSHITITTYSDMPHSGYYLQNGTYVGIGVAFDLLKLIVRKLNFTYTIIPPEKDVIGSTTTGMIKQLNKSEVDMAVAFIPILHQFREHMEFSTPVDETDTTFLMKRPPTSSSGSGLLAPFSDKVWILIFIAMLFVGPTIYAVIHLRSKIAKDERVEKFTLMTCMWFVYGALLKQGTAISPIGDSTRLVFATWWIFITILTSFYTANLTAFLTLSKFTLGVNSIEDLVYGRYQWFIINGRSIDAIMTSGSQDTRLLEQSHRRYGFRSHDHNASTKNLLYDVSRDKVFIGERALAQMAIFEDYREKTEKGMDQEKRCTYVISEKNVLAKIRGFGFPKNSPLKKYMDQELIAAVECGLVKHFVSAKLPEAQICPLNLKSKERRLKVSDLLMTYKVVFSGMGVAVIIFLLELLSRLCRRFVDPKWVKCCKLGEIKGTSAPDYTWDTSSKKLDPNSWIKTPPPVYQMNNNQSPAKTYSINGRDYYIITEDSGDQRLIPIRTPSAYLFNSYIRSY